MNTITQITTRRQAIIKYAEKKGVTAAARRYNVGRASIYRWMKRYDGTLESLKDRSGIVKKCAVRKHPKSKIGMYQAT